MTTTEIRAETRRLADCDVEALESAPARRVRVAEPVRFGTSPDNDIEHLRMLRELTSRTIRVDWRIDGEPAFDLRDHVHLVPPAADDDDPPIADEWRSGYRYGTLYYRNGPTFISVKDVRPGGEHARMTIDRTGTEHFRLLANRCRLDELPEDTLDALETALELGLAIRGREQFLLLPYRMRAWPVPYVAV